MSVHSGKYGTDNTQTKHNPDESNEQPLNKGQISFHEANICHHIKINNILFTFYFDYSTTVILLALCNVLPISLQKFSTDYNTPDL